MPGSIILLIFCYIIILTESKFIDHAWVKAIAMNKVYFPF
jgi:hypothetical protein